MKKEVEPGDILEVLADCATFEQDVKAWCTAMHKVLLFMRDEPGERQTLPGEDLEKQGVSRA